MGSDATTRMLGTAGPDAVWLVVLNLSLSSAGVEDETGAKLKDRASVPKLMAQPGATGDDT